MSDYNKTLFACRLVPVINDILAAINEIYEAKSCERESRVNAILKTNNACKQGFNILGDLCLQPVKPRWADFTDAGPGVGVSNYEVRFCDAELARIHNSDYRVRCHRSRGDSGQGEAERTNSAISDALVDGATLEWEKHKRFEDLTKEEIKNMSLHKYEEYEKKRMEKNAWHVCKMVTERIDDAPVLNEYINSKVSELPEKLFFFNSTQLNTYRNASVNNKMKVPGSAYFIKIEKFIDKHYVAGELFMEFCRDACKEQREGRIILCSWCSSKRWVGPETDRIPQPVPDENNPGHYMHVYQTKLTDRTPDDYLPRKCLKDLHAQNAISTDDRQSITSFCSTYNVEEEHVIAYIGHLNDINLRKDIRAN